MVDKFETLWLEKRKQILMADDEYRKATESYKMVSGADWLLFGMPVVAAIIAIDQSFFKSEILNWLFSAAVAIMAFVIAVIVKTLTNGSRPISVIEAEIKERCRKEYEITGKL